MRDHYWKGLEGPPTRGARMLHAPASALVRAAWSVRVHGLDHVPATGPVILAANHTGFLDGPLLYCVVRRPVHAIVKQEMFDGPLGRLLTGAGQISVDRFQVDPGAVKAALAVLDREDILAIYPEGTRGAGDFAEIKPGVAYLGLCTGAPIVPVVALGVRRRGGSTGSLPGLRSRLDVVFGSPIDVSPVAWPRRRDLVVSTAGRIQERLIEHVQHAIDLTGRNLP